MNVNKFALAGVIAFLAASMYVGVSPVHADRGPCGFLGGTFTIQYFQNAALTTAWTNYAPNGVGMCSFPNNNSPVVGLGQTIYVKIIVSGLAAGTNMWYEIDGGQSPYPPPAFICTTDATGSCKGSTSWTNNVTPQPTCITVPEKIGLGGSTTTPPLSTVFDGHIIDHFFYGTGSPCTPSVPEFSLPAFALFAALAPAAFILRRRLR